ncbi:hypothetical protein GA0116948_11161 [Chitinophaga costaii]|uniref:Uncharacterized protein n=1 Tax=Chitinophaga costaii TaxID=1335309 RepID=A0A1C4F2L0_9BACT|nr:hypothetical protein [Chitinophaga costaii]PUZ22120.1 hypothetical protein DCM91_15470 [Chitinophaga costaii]SCC50094.1 hypothetical protein GA0116948_11161 [Chitinophaga costaii]
MPQFNQITETHNGEAVTRYRLDNQPENYVCLKWNKAAIGTFIEYGVYTDNERNNARHVLNQLVDVPEWYVRVNDLRQFHGITAWPDYLTFYVLLNDHDIAGIRIQSSTVLQSRVINALLNLCSVIERGNRTFTPKLALENGNERIRWVCNEPSISSIVFCQVMVSHKTLLDAAKFLLSANDFRKLYEIITHDLNWYVNVAELSSQNKGDLTLYCDLFDIHLRLQDSRYIKWIDSFRIQAEEWTPAKFQADSNNIFGRFYNYPEDIPPQIKYYLISSDTKIKDIFKDIISKKVVHHFWQQRDQLGNDLKEVFIGTDFRTAIDHQTYTNYHFDGRKVDGQNLPKELVDQSDFTSHSEIRQATTVINASKLKVAGGLDRRPSQDALMAKNSANAIANAAYGQGMSDVRAFEWLHLIAFSFGLGTADKLETAQIADNLVLGTAAANSQMLIYEASIKSIIQADPQLLAEVSVLVKHQKIKDNLYARWLVSEISYHITFLKNNQTVAKFQLVFNPFHAFQPSVGEYLLVKQQFAKIVLPKKVAAHLLAEDLNQLQAVAPLGNVSAFDLGNGVHFNNLERLKTGEPPNTGNYSTLTGISGTDGELFKAQVSLLGGSNLPAKFARLSNRYIEAHIEWHEDSFHLEQLFPDIQIDAGQFFVFENVSFGLKKVEGSDSSTQAFFQGNLKMDEGLLASIRDALHIQGMPLLSGTVDLQPGDTLDKPLSARGFEFSIQTALSAEIVEGLSLTDIKLAIIGYPTLDFKDLKNSWGAGLDVNATLQLGFLGTPQPVDLHARLTIDQQQVGLYATAEHVEGLFGLKNVSLDLLDVSLVFGQQTALMATLHWRSSIGLLSFAGHLSSDASAVQASLESFSFQNLAYLFADITGIVLQAPAVDITLEKLILSLATNECQLNGTTIPKGIHFLCKVSIGEVIAEVDAILDSTHLLFRGEIQNLTIGGVMVEDAELCLDLYGAGSEHTSEVYIKGKIKKGEVTVTCKAAYYKMKDTWNMVAYGEVEAPVFMLSTLIPAVKDSFVDALKFNKFGLMLAKENAAETITDFPYPVKKGLQAVAIVDEIVPLSKLTGTKQSGLQFTAQLGEEISMAISMPEATLQLGRHILCEPFQIGIELRPKVAFLLHFPIAVILDNQTLHFVVALDIGMLEATASLSETTWWDEPFGLRNLRVGPALAVQLGINYAQFASTGFPSQFGIAGGLEFGDIQAQMAVNVATDPSKFILFGELDKLTPQKLITAINKCFNAGIPEKNVPDFFQLEQLKLYIAPNGGSIGTITYEAGFSFAANIKIFDKEFSLFASIGSNGLKAKGSLSALSIGPLEIHGYEKQNISLELAITSQEQLFHFDGAISLMGLSFGVLVHLSKELVRFDFELHFTKELSLEIHGQSTGSLSSPASMDFILDGKFEQALVKHVTEQLEQIFHALRDSAVQGLGEAQRKVNETEAAYQKVFDEANKKLEETKAAYLSYVNQLTQALDQTKADYAKALEEAKAAVQQAKAAYNNALESAQKTLDDAKRSYLQQFTKAQEEVDQAQKAYSQALGTAERAVEQARVAYDGYMKNAQQGLRSAKAYVDRLNSEIDSAHLELKKAHWWEVHKEAYYGTKIAALTVSHTAAIAALKVAEGVVYATSKCTQFVAFEAAKKVLEGVKTGGEYTAFESSKLALGVVKAAGEKSVALAQLTVEGVEKGAEYTVWMAAEASLIGTKAAGEEAIKIANIALENVQKSAAYAAFATAEAVVTATKHGTSAIAFETAKAALKMVELQTTIVLDVAAYAVKFAGQLFDLQLLELHAQLKDVKNLKLFRLHIKGAVVGQNIDLTLDADISNIPKMIQETCIELVKEVHQLISPA